MTFWQAQLVGSGLEATVICAQADWQPPPSLAEFLADLDANSQGWEGDRSWVSSEGELRLTARHDKTNTVLVDVEMDQAAPPGWRCTAELELSPGVFRGMAADARRIITAWQAEYRT
jgi:hypothetical protein